MSERPELKRLHLRAPLSYRRASADFRAPEADASEGEERLFAWSVEAVSRLEAGDGPRLLAPLPAPEFSGLRAAPGEAAELRLEPGEWIFLQSQVLDTPEGLLEYFLREAWWEREAAEGAIYLRQVREDGKWAFQAWRRRGEA